MSVFCGPTRPLRVPPPQARDDVESKRLSDAMSRLSCGSAECTIKLVESVAQRLVEQVIAETEGRWVRAYPFGSCGLAASVADSDIDMYGEFFLFSTPLLYSF
ncbi:poly(A) polymerase [Trypanosoma theileri]|uniref:Poly(A) polymerase n=1 Tax=Trypanosoma theileri TaxID=67003 RepID=A0A1X0P906_9TRYP|nr:poly(A) polymerase [Trypanosoma theileri]ORC93427.1 poly(A) polymerase [Trypanosoma theileri]